MMVVSALVFIFLGAVCSGVWLATMNAKLLRAISNGAALLAIAFFVFATMAALQAAKAHDGYQDWRMPDAPNVSCCNDSDCRPTRAYVDEDGVWRAWNGHAWLRVPPNKILPTDFKKDGRSHLCEKNGAIYCFSPSEPKS